MATDLCALKNCLCGCDPACARLGYQLLPASSQVQALFDRSRLQSGNRNLVARQFGQPRRHRPTCLRPERPHQFVELFATPHRTCLRFGYLDFCLRVRRLLAGKIKVSEVAGFVHFQRRLSRTFGRVRYCLSKIDKLLISLMFIKRGAHFSCCGKNFMTDAQLGRFKLCRRDSLA